MNEAGVAYASTVVLIKTVSCGWHNLAIAAPARLCVEREWRYNSFNSNI